MIYGESSQSRDYIHVSDVVETLVAAMLRPREGP
ncbi:NAD-dependent epimerase/dehydratase family protein [Silicimonas algicola]